MDIETIDQAYGALQQQAQQVFQEIKELADKLNAAAQKGNPDAREWSLDLKEIALAVQAEQNQMQSLLQALHGYLSNQVRGGVGGMPQSQPYGGAQPQGGFLGGLFNSGFGQALEMGAGFAIADDLINSLFW